MIQKKLIAIFGENYRTTICGFVTAIASFYVAVPSAAKWQYTVPIAQLIMGGGVLGLGLQSKDSDNESSISDSGFGPRIDGPGLVDRPSQVGSPTRSGTSGDRWVITHSSQPSMGLDGAGVGVAPEYNRSAMATEAARRIQQSSRAPVTTESLEAEIAAQNRWVSAQAEALKRESAGTVPESMTGSWDDGKFDAPGEWSQWP